MKLFKCVKNLSLYQIYDLKILKIFLTWSCLDQKQNCTKVESWAQVCMYVCSKHCVLYPELHYLPQAIRTRDHGCIYSTVNAAFLALWATPLSGWSHEARQWIRTHRHIQLPVSGPDKYIRPVSSSRRPTLSANTDWNVINFLLALLAFTTLQIVIVK
jgi:hypothetical protein